MVPTTFTNLSNIGLTAYYLVRSRRAFFFLPSHEHPAKNAGTSFAHSLPLLKTATYHSYSYCRHKDLRSLTSQHRFLSLALSLLYASVVVFHIVVPAIYWSMLFDPNNTMDGLNKYVDFSHHGADLACILVEMLFNRMELPWISILGPMTMIILYMFLAWVYFAA
jgi:hypothetical protein